MKQETIPVKCVIVGDGYVGKTSILVSYTQNRFQQGYQPTIFDNYATTVKVDGKIVKLGLWDTAGQQQYARLRPLAYPSTDVFLITFSVIQPSTFINARKKWYPEIHQICPQGVKIFVGNKVDLRAQYEKMQKDPKKAPIIKDTAQRLIKEEHHCKYFQCSALTQQGIKQIFTQAVRQVILRNQMGGMSNKKPTQCKICQKCQLI